MMDLMGALLGFVLTIFVFSYLWGDNALFRTVVHIFIGVTAAYVAIVTIQSVILPQIIFPFTSGDPAAKTYAIVFLILSVLMLTKISPRLHKLGNPALAYLVGVGAAAAVGGAVVGTLLPQTSAAINVFTDNNLLNGFVVLLGTLTTLIYFHFGVFRKKGGAAEASADTTAGTEIDAQRSPVLESLGQVGQGFIAITLGALFSGVYLAAITALVERLDYLWNLVRSIPMFFS